MVLNAYVEWGAKSTKLFNGMFAYAQILREFLAHVPRRKSKENQLMRFDISGDRQIRSRSLPLCMKQRTAKTCRSVQTEYCLGTRDDD